MAEEDKDWADEAEAHILEAALIHAPDVGWTRRTIAAGARDAGFSLPEAELLMPNGPRDLAALFSRRHDRIALDSLAGVDSSTLKIRDRIRRAVLARCDAALADAAPTRSWTGFLALPSNIPLGLRLAWASADVFWRWAGDTATDENHYTKRALLAGILVSTLAVRLASGNEAAADHLDRRIAGVMRFEKWKNALRVADLATGAAGVLGRLRYGSARA